MTDITKESFRQWTHVRKADHKSGELNFKGKASNSGGAENAKRLDIIETRAGIRGRISMQMRPLLLYL